MSFSKLMTVFIFLAAGVFISISFSATPSGFRTDQQVLRAMKRENNTIIGDMILPPVTSKRSAFLYFPNWPDNQIPFLISDNVTSDLSATVYEAIDYYHRYTCVRFVPAYPTFHTYWVRFLMDPALVANPNSDLLCSAEIGFRNKKDQAVLLGKKCNFGSMVHELEHTLGFMHEHARTDRDYYLTMYEQNMQEAAKSQFKREDVWCRDAGGTTSQCQFDTYRVPFNYDSIMNYCQYCGSKNNYPVMSSKKNSSSLGDITGNNLGQMEGFSYGDWLAINRKHGCNIGEGENAGPGIEPPGTDGIIPQPPPIPENPSTPNPFPKPQCKPKNKNYSWKLPPISIIRK